MVRLEERQHILNDPQTVLMCQCRCQEEEAFLCEGKDLTDLTAI